MDGDCFKLSKGPFVDSINEVMTHVTFSHRPPFFFFFVKSKIGLWEKTVFSESIMHQVLNVPPTPYLKSTPNTPKTTEHPARSSHPAPTDITAPFLTPKPRCPVATSQPTLVTKMVATTTKMTTRATTGTQTTTTTSNIEYQVPDDPQSRTNTPEMKPCKDNKL